MDLRFSRFHELFGLWVVVRLYWILAEPETQKRGQASVKMEVEKVNQMKQDVLL